jgi:hypothetical protein
MEIVKQKLLSEPLSQRAVKFARAIYFTHLKDEANLYLEIKMTSIMKLLGVFFFWILSAKARHEEKLFR